MKDFYITTPIFYVNDKPHIGHAYTEVCADFIARWHRASGQNSFLLTGTDEHGQKIMASALSHGTEPKAWADNLVNSSWKPLLELLNISNNDFIRTTETRHINGVKYALNQLYKKGYIYKGQFEGYYCVGCEEYKSANELIDENLCPIHLKPIDILKETNYFFKLSAFQERLLELYAKNKEFIKPASAYNEIVSFVKQGLNDLSISRSSFDWGIKLPWDESHVLYVWIDALLNYLTAIGFGTPAGINKNIWPCDVHIVGKDILRFHSVIWPAVLMALEIEFPKQIFGHGWLLVAGEKMSKSRLTGISPKDIVDKIGDDAFRYYFIRYIHFGGDGSFSYEDIIAKYNADLANSFGNLVSRTFAMLNKYFDGEIFDCDLDNVIVNKVKSVCNNAAAYMQDLNITGTLETVFNLADDLNGYITEKQPWVLAKDGKIDILKQVLMSVIYGIGAFSYLISPALIKSSEKVLNCISSAGAGDINIQDAYNWWSYKLKHLGALDGVLFQKIDI